jgi:hypothetical protein
LLTFIVPAMLLLVAKVIPDRGRPFPGAELIGCSVVLLIAGLMITGLASAVLGVKQGWSRGPAYFGLALNLRPGLALIALMLHSSF